MSTATAVACLFGATASAARSEPGWRWPLPDPTEVVRAFHPPDVAWGPGHRGVDLAAGPGTPVLAAGHGRVSYAGILAGRGVVAIRHDGGLRTTYEPLRVTVHVGQPVEAGAVIGTLLAGHPGCPRAACLHWGLLRGDTYLDPLSLLGSGPVRLLPLAATPAAASHSAHLTETPRGTGPAPRLRSQSTAAALGLALAGAVVLARRRPP